MAVLQSFLSVLSNNTGNTDLVGEWADQITVRQGKSANIAGPLQAILTKIEPEEADNTVFNWWERDPTRLTIYSSAAQSDTTTAPGNAGITLQFDDNGSTPASVNPYLIKGTTLMNDRTLETVRVTSDPSSTLNAAVTVTRGVGYQGSGADKGGVNTMAILDNDVWTIVTKGVDEGATAGTAIFETPSSYQNYIQTFQETIEMSNQFKSNVLRTDKQGARDQAVINAFERQVNRMEFAYLLGQKDIKGTGAYLTGGLKWYLDIAATADTNLAGNILEANGTAGVSLTALLGWIQSFMVNGSDTKLMFCGPLAYSAISTYANSNAGGFRIMNNSGNVFGMNITEIQTPFGVLGLAMHPLMKNSLAMQDWGFVFDLQLIRNKTMTPLYFEENIQTPGQLTWKAQFVAMQGLKLVFPGAFGYVKNLRLITA